MSGGAAATESMNDVLELGGRGEESRRKDGGTGEAKRHQFDGILSLHWHAFPPQVHVRAMFLIRANNKQLTMSQGNITDKEKNGRKSNAKCKKWMGKGETTPQRKEGRKEKHLELIIHWHSFEIKYLNQTQRK
ncbi:hypothetical protein niasHT_004658 [Heterodera trifolii]|uniref:Uncharacterized protein n=1 Tax=Heterodera trifolii TaxID=157864 RepID=A0ABD2M9D0_9BILA